MRFSKLQTIYISTIFIVVIAFLGISFSGILREHIDIETAIYILTVNMLAIMAFFYMNNSENFKKNNLKSLKKSYIREAPWHLVFAIITTISIVILQYFLNFNIYCPSGANACVLASTKYGIFTWIAITGVVFGGVLVSFVLVAISLILLIYVPLSIILKSEAEIGSLK